MLEDAIMGIRRANAEALRRRAALLSRRRPIRQLDNKSVIGCKSRAQGPHGLKSWSMSGLRSYVPRATGL